MASTVDLAGALAAIEQRLKDNWTTTPIIFDNDNVPDVWPPQEEDGSPSYWVFCELIDIDANIIGFGKPGDQTVSDIGKIMLSVMMPKGRGLAVGRQYAVALGEIFRQKKFFGIIDPTAYVRTYTPAVGRGSMTSEDGNWVSMACTVEYEFIHRA